MRRLLTTWYLASPVFALIDVVTGFNVRTAFLGDSPLRFGYYAASFLCGVVAQRRPALAPIVGMAESGLNVGLVIVGLYLRVWAVAADETAAALPMGLVINAGLSGLVFAASFYSSEARMRARGRGTVVPRYAAFLRGVMPTNAKMPELKAAFEAAGFTDVKTLLSSGNLSFNAAKASDASLQKKAEAAMKRRLGREFLTIVRSIDALNALLAADPYQAFRLAPGSKRIVTFLREPPASKVRLPVEQDGARILVLKGMEVFSAYERTPKGPVFMTLIEKNFGKEQTTRTWDTIAKVAGGPPLR